MIRSATRTNPNPNPIPVPILSSKVAFLIGFLCLFIFSVSGMESRVLSVKRSLADSNLTFMGAPAQKKLRRLPHVFSRILELPLKSDADVAIEVKPSWIRFVVAVGEGDLCNGDRRVRASAIEVYAGVVKVVIRENETDDDLDGVKMDVLELDRWRYRLPAATRPECATAVCVDGELVVTVPKDSIDVPGDGVENWTGIDRLIEVQ